MSRYPEFAFPYQYNCFPENHNVLVDPRRFGGFERQQNQVEIEQTFSASYETALPATAEATSSRYQPQEPNPSSAKWTVRETEYLVQLWAENITMIESKDTRKTWKKIATAVSQQFKVVRTSEQCIRKIKYLKEKYKNAKDWNNKQTGGNMRKSVMYDEIDAVLGCKDSQTLHNIEEAGCSSSENSFNDEASQESSYETGSESGEASAHPKKKAEGRGEVRKREQTQRKKNKKRMLQDGKDEQDTAQFSEAVESFKAQGERISQVIEQFQVSQNRQLDVMNNFIGVFSNFLNKK